MANGVRTAFFKWFLEMLIGKIIGSIDSDGDGVPDSQDAEPHNPEVQ